MNIRIWLSMLWIFALWSTALGFNRPEPMDPDDYDHIMIQDGRSDVEIAQDQVIPSNTSSTIQTITPAYESATVVEAQEPILAIEDEPMLYPVEPLTVGRPIPVPPPIMGGGPMIDMPYFGWGSELDAYFYQFCESSSETYSCTRYDEVVQRLSPKVLQLSELIKSTFDEERQEEIRWMIRNIIENKFYEVATEKSKFTISFIRIALQENLYEEDVEDVDSWLWDAITNLSSVWQIVWLSEAPGDLTMIVWDRITSSNNTFWIEVDARFDSDRPVTPEQWYEVLAHFGDVGVYFIDRENIRNANYNAKRKTRQFDGNGEYGYRSAGKVPDKESVSIYLLCNYCEWEEFHPDRWNSRIADIQTYTFDKIDDNMSFDVELDVSDHSARVVWDDTVISINYKLHNIGTEEIAWVRTIIRGYPMTDSRWYWDEMVDRQILSANCAGNAIDANDFLDGNIVLWSDQSCSVSESVTIQSISTADIDLSIDVEARMDQNRNNNNRNTIILAS